MLGTLLFSSVLLAQPPDDLQAIGVVVAGRPERSVALLRSAGRTRVASPGETAFGGRVLAIGPEAVSLEFASGRVELRLPKSAGASPAQGQGAPDAAPAAPPAPAGVDAASGREMARGDVQARLAQELPRILAETALRPVTEDGQVVGFALARVAQGTLLTEAGLQAGDVLTRINGTPIDSLATLMALWGRLQGESHLNALVLRDGRPVSLSLSLK